jgi:hypothetical protein
VNSPWKQFLFCHFVAGEDEFHTVCKELLSAIVTFGILRANKGSVQPYLYCSCFVIPLQYTVILLLKLYSIYISFCIHFTSRITVFRPL